MEFEQIVKQLEWLDEEHRNDKQIIAQLSEKLVNYESTINILSNQIKDLSKEFSKFSTTDSRIDQAEKTIKSNRDDLIKNIKTVETNLIKIQQENEKKINLELSGITKSIKQFQKTTNIKEVRQNIDARIREEERLSKALNSLEDKLSLEKNFKNEIQLSVQILEENLKIERKKTLDILNEHASQKKKFDELNNQVTLLPENIRRVETRLNELISTETERKQSQKTFLEQQALLQIDRDQMQKDLKEKIDNLGNQSQLYETQLQQWDSIQREVQRAQQVYEDLTHKFERRINEITEMQRLSEDRFRQEWTTFKADHQKRWTSYSLSQDELFSEMKSEIQGINETLAPLEDMTQAQQDITQQTWEAQEEYYQAVLAQINMLLTTYNKIIDSTKKK